MVCYCHDSLVFLHVDIEFHTFGLNFLAIFSVQKANFFNAYNKDNCTKLNHVTSHTNHLNRSATSLDMICETNANFHLASFATSQPVILRAKKSTIKIIKIHQNVTVINFNEKGFATLYFESIDDARNFNKIVYPLLKKKLEVITHLNFTPIVI